MPLRFNEPETHTVFIHWEDAEMAVDIKMPEGLTHDEQETFMDGAAAGIVGFLSQYEVGSDEDDDDEDS